MSPKDLSLGISWFEKSCDYSGIPATFNTFVELLRVCEFLTKGYVSHKRTDYYPMSVTFRKNYIIGQSVIQNQILNAL